MILSKKLFALLICIPVLVAGCGGAAPALELPEKNVVIGSEAYVEEKLIADEIIPLNNCGGNSKLAVDVERSREFTHIITDKNGYELGFEHYLVAALEKEYDIENGTKETQSHTIHLETETDSHVVYTIAWKEIWLNGDAVVHDESGTQNEIPYRVKKDITFEIKDIKAVSCDMVPLKLFWHPDRKDNVTVATEQGENAQEASDYRFVRVEGYVFPNQRPDTVPLKLYWSPTRKDNVLVASREGESAQLESGYKFVRVEGFIFTRPQSGTIPLNLYWHPERQDNATVAEGEGEQAQLASDYEFVRIEGYIFPAD